MRELTKTKVLFITSLVVSLVLFFFSVSMLMGNGANIVVPYTALSIAIALSISILIIGVIKTRRTVFLQTENIPVKSTLQMPIENPVIVAYPSFNDNHVAQKVENNPLEQKIEPSKPIVDQPFHYTKNVREVQKSESQYQEQKTKPVEKSSAQPFSYQKIQERIAKAVGEPNKRFEDSSKPLEKIPAQKNIVKSSDEKPLAEQDIVKDENGKFTCPKCSKGFSQPIFMANYSDSKQPKLIAHCPYCDQTLDIKQENSEEEELLKKYF